MKFRIVHKKDFADPVFIGDGGAERKSTTDVGANGARRGEKLLRFDSWCDLGAPDAKKFETVKDKEGNVVDYRDVILKGYLSTFKATTESDRQGDYVEPGAFTETLARFKKNPVLLANHRNGVESVVGTFTTIREDKTGLYVEAKLSNSPAPTQLDVRFKVAEGSLRALSMGGIFHYKEDGRGIFKVDLWEGSIVAIPANPDALFAVRELTAEDNERLAELTN